MNATIVIFFVLINTLFTALGVWCGYTAGFMLYEDGPTLSACLLMAVAVQCIIVRGGAK